MAKPAIPVVNTEDRTVNQAFAAIKENIELLTGSRPGSAPLPLLASTATLADVISAMNSLISRINYK